MEAVIFAVPAVIFFAITFILHAFTHSSSKVAGDLEILGFLFIAAQLAWGYAGPWFSARRTGA